MCNNVRWLSGGQVLERFVASLNKIRQFINEKEQDYQQPTDACWLTNLMIFTDFTEHFNILNKKITMFWKNSRQDVL